MELIIEHFWKFILVLLIVVFGVGTIIQMIVNHAFDMRKLKKEIEAERHKHVERKNDQLHKYALSLANALKKKQTESDQSSKLNEND